MPYRRKDTSGPTSGTGADERALADQRHVLEGAVVAAGPGKQPRLFTPVAA